jgi:hypothetical protein
MTIVYDTRDYWLLGFVRSPKFKRTRRFGNWVCFRPHLMIEWEAPDLITGSVIRVSSLERTQQSTVIEVSSF